MVVQFAYRGSSQGGSAKRHPPTGPVAIHGGLRTCGANPPYTLALAMTKQKRSRGGFALKTCSEACKPESNTARG